MSLRIIGGIMHPLVRASTIKVTDPLKIRQDFERTACVFSPAPFACFIDTWYMLVKKMATQWVGRAPVQSPASDFVHPWRRLYGGQSEHSPEYDCAALQVSWDAGLYVSTPD
jgi:hypothetical protein